ncbi:stalk domain-containing protein [Bacillus sp. Marseille-P3661]|uniref:stalk domain-containing protein n=1 Tax=Bacillus sp. Marseille-P3661 TaxID=1936234 RepID=UPI000C848E7C|nr:stalk domain-containing protein [Bacillus sp. Marseille-P3661]
MKKIISILIFNLLILNAVVVSANETDTNGEIALLVGNNQSIVAGKKVAIDPLDKNIKPIIKNNRTLIPIRFVSERFGASVDWDNETRIISIQVDHNQLKMTVGISEIDKNGKITNLDVAPEILNDRTYLPIRAVTEAMGKEILYKNGLIIISDQEKTYNEDDLVNLINQLNNGIVLMVDSNQSIVDGKITPLDSGNTPVIKEYRTLVPIRFVAQQFGANVDWNPQKQAISIELGNNELELVVGSSLLKKNGSSTKIDVAPQIINGSTYLPIRAISESLGKEIFYKDGLIFISEVEVNYTDPTIAIFAKQLKPKGIQKTTAEIVRESKESVVIIKGLNNGTVGGFGTGFFVGEGLVMTNAHVINGFDDLVIEDYTGKTYTVEGIYKYDIKLDLAVLKLDKIQAAKSLKLGEVTKNETGENVIAIGHSAGLYWSATQGIISDFREEEFFGVTYIQTDAAVTHGGSGGPLFNKYGEVIGVISQGVENEKFNFAVIPKGELYMNYQEVDYNTMPLISAEYFEASYQESSSVLDAITSYLRAFLSNNKDYYISTLHPNSPYFQLEVEYFDETAALYNGYESEINGFVVDKYGDTFLANAGIVLTKDNENKYLVNMFARLEYNENAEKYQFIVTYLDIEEIGGGQTPSHEDPPLEVVDKSIDFYQNLDFKPYDVKFDEENGIIYMIDKGSKSLVKYSIEDKRMDKQTFEYMPERLDLDHGKVYVTLISQEHSSYVFEEDQTGYIGVVDADTLDVIKIIDIGFDPYDVAAVNGFIYVPGGSGQWTDIRSYSEETGIEVDRARISEASPVEKHPSGDKLYTITTNSSPRDMSVYMINNGQIVTSYDSIYHGDYPMLVGFTFSPDGKFIYNHSGVIFKTGYGRESDIQYFNKFNQSINSVAFDTESNKMFVNVGSAGMINVYDATTLKGIGTLQTSTTVNFMSVINQKIITIEHKGGDNGINVIETK